VIPVRRPNSRVALDAKTRSYLKKKTAEARSYLPHDPRIETSWSNLLQREGRLRKKNQPHVGSALDDHTRGKCAYCEQVAAKTVEHYYPRSLFPHRMFAWSNLLRGCFNCNIAKLDRFPLDGAGRRLLLDPCSDDPLDYFVWDPLTGATGLTQDPSRQPRAGETRALFQLDQEALREERRNKLGDIMYLLANVVRESPVRRDTRDRLREHLQPHRPWLGPIRELFLRPTNDDIRALVEQAQAKLPVIRNWINPWI
jgi:uncharacterized protein (TIGR02646 family)